MQEGETLKAGIAKLLGIRKSMGILSDSKITILLAKPEVYIAQIEGTRGMIRIQLGSGSTEAVETSSEDGWIETDTREGFTIWVKANIQ